MIALGLVAMGVITLVWDDFGLNWQDVPKWVPARGVFAYAAGAVEIVAGLALLLRPTAAAAGLFLTFYTFAWLLLCDVHHVLAKPTVEASWLSIGERTEQFAGVWTLYILLARAQGRFAVELITSDRALLFARTLFGLALIPIGFSHLVYLKVTAGLVPAWLPDREAWAFATGVGHVAAGVALVLGVVPRLAATMEALMLTSFVLLVQVPMLVDKPDGRLPWTMLAAATLIAGAAWSVARSLADRPWLLRAAAD
jgi:uncharacterized membrane protein